MAQNITPVNQPLPPAPLKSRQRIEAGSTLRERFTAGITMPYPIMSIRGKEFTLKHNGQEHVIGPEVELILVNSSDKMNKAFYIKGYDGGNDQPDCYSFDAIKPDPNAPHIQNVTCIGCNWNAFKSAKGQNGEQRPGKACSDSRKLVLAFRNDLLGHDLGPIMLRLPVTSHQNLYAYIVDIAKAGFEPNACTTKLSFARGNDGSVLSYPKLHFSFGDALTDDEYEIAEQWETSDQTQRILRAPPEGEVPSEQGMSQAQPVYNAAMGANRPRPTPVPSEPTPAPRPTPQPAPEPTPEPPPVAASSDQIIDIGGRAFNMTTRKWVGEEEVPSSEEDVAAKQQAGWTPPTSAPSYQQDEVTRQVTAPRQRKTRTPPTIEATANPTPEPTPEPEAPKSNGKAQAAPMDLDAILGKMMPKRT